MTRHAKRLLIAALFLFSAFGCATNAPADRSLEPPAFAESPAPALVLATFNVEHLALPPALGCRPRSAAEVDALREYVAALDADVVALQEVASREAVQQLFSEELWRIVISARPDSEPYDCRESGEPSTQQKVAFAIRREITASSPRHYDELALGVEGLRYGLSVTVDTPAGPAEILNLHLKSGCFVDDYLTRDTEACALFSRQAQWLDAWVEEKERARLPYVILGDLNHRISAPYNRLTRLLRSNADGAEASATILTRDLIGCHPRYPAPIDHIVVGGELASSGGWSAAVHHFVERADDAEAMLSDHCAVTATLAPAAGELSTAVRWVRQSKERELITRAVYADATRALRPQARDEEDWVVMLDVDETLLDNSAYQVFLDRTGQSFSGSTWASWVAQERATSVPGAVEFVDAVIAAGGKVALVTNRESTMNAQTWANLDRAGFSLTPENACLLGRTPADKSAIDGDLFVNDKDKRRQDIREGRPACYPGTTSVWLRPQHIAMQIGDNIQDLDSVTQQSAKPLEMLESLGSEHFLLPNPTYGSWQ